MFNYNTQQKKMQLPEYGRSVQNMVDHALTIEDRQERQRCANTIINIMGNMFPQLRDVPDFKHKLWDHLAIMSDFKLDIDYPYEIVKAEELNPQPERIPIPVKQVRYRHYGHMVMTLVDQAAGYEDGAQKDNLTAQVCNYMRRCHQTWNKDNVSDEVIAQDLQIISNGRLSLTPEILKLMNERMEYFNRQRPTQKSQGLRQDPKAGQNQGKNQNMRKQSNRP